MTGTALSRSTAAEGIADPTKEIVRLSVAAPDPSIRTDAIYVIYTSPQPTLDALHAAAGFARTMSVPITLVHFRTVPYTLPLSAPTGISPVQSDEFLSYLRAAHLDPDVRVHLCRRERDVIGAALKPHSLVVVGRGRHQWQRSSVRWCRLLEAAGHYVVIAGPQDTPENTHA